MKKERVDSEITAESPQDNEFVSDAFQEDQINEEDLKKEMEMLGVEDGKFKDEGMMIAKLDRTSRGRELDHGLVPYFCGNWSWNYFYGHSPFCWFKKGCCQLQVKVFWLLLIIVKLAQEKSVVRWTDRPDMTIAVDCNVKNQTKKTKFDTNNTTNTTQHNTTPNHCLG